MSDNRRMRVSYIKLPKARPAALPRVSTVSRGRGPPTEDVLAAPRRQAPAGNPHIATASYAAVMVTALQAVAVAHVFFGVLWVGANFYMDVVWYRPWKTIQTAGELRTWQRLLRPSGMFLGMSAVLVIATGLTYMFMKYGTDFGVIWASSSGRLILISFALVIVAFLFAVAVTNRLSTRFVRLAAPEEEAAPVPAEAKDLMGRIMAASAVGTTLIVVVLVLMVLAATG